MNLTQKPQFLINNSILVLMAIILTAQFKTIIFIHELIGGRSIPSYNGFTISLIQNNTYSFQVVATKGDFSEGRTDSTESYDILLNPDKNKWNNQIFQFLKTLNRNNLKS